MSADDTILSLDEEMELLVAEMREKAPKSVCPVDRKAREVCTSCEG